MALYAERRHFGRSRPAMSGTAARSSTSRASKRWFAGQYMVRHNLQVAEVAAKHHISIDAHEPVKDTGLRRTWPNMRKPRRRAGPGVQRLGQSDQPARAHGDPAVHADAGRADGLHARRLRRGARQGRPDPPRPVDPGVQLALYVVLYSPIQMAADLPENYEASPRRLPVHPRRAHRLGASPDPAAARSATTSSWPASGAAARTGSWGAPTDETARKLTQKLDFLAPGKRYEAQIYADGPGADYITNTTALVVSKKVVTSKDSLEFDMAPGGGRRCGSRRSIRSYIRCHPGKRAALVRDPGEPQSLRPVTWVSDSLCGASGMTTLVEIEGL